MSSIGKGLNSVLSKDKKTTYLYANSGNVTLGNGVVTQLLNFRTPNGTSKLKFEIFIPSALTVAGDKFTIKYYQDANTVEKFDFLQVGTGTLIRPIRINKILEANTPFIVEIKFDAAGLTPAVESSCNVSGRVL